MKLAQTMRGVCTLVAALTFTVMAAGVADAQLQQDAEIGCSKAMTKTAGKYIAGQIKTVSKCLATDTLANCLADAKIQSKLAKNSENVAKAAEKKCTSTCGSTSIICQTELQCPPNNAQPVNCSGGGTNVLDILNMGFPGAFCPAILGKATIDNYTEFGECLDSMIGGIADTVQGAVLGSLENTEGTLSEAGQDCYDTIAKSVPKTVGKMAGIIGKCRDTQNGLPTPTILLNDCPTADEKTVASLIKEAEKLDKSLRKKCTDSAVLELDICNAGVGGTATLDDAVLCLTALAREAAESTKEPARRAYGIAPTIIEAAYPEATSASCGDNIVNQDPNPFALVGEECDGTDDSACPGECFPPGDIWECTCPTTPRQRRLSISAKTDLASGWRGNSHNSSVAEGAGFVTQVSGCDCDAFDTNNPGDCIGTTSDPICDQFGQTQPQCSWDLVSNTSCDDYGDNNGFNNNDDCARCNGDALNAGDYCFDELDCASQCFDADGMATGTPCNTQAQCGEGQICRGRCDKSGTCNRTPNGAPIPLLAQGTPACVVSLFDTNVTGTSNIVTGAHEQYYALKSLTHLGILKEKPCPVCGGICLGGTRPGEICEGRCSVTDTTKCRFDSDCPTGTCSVTVAEACNVDDDCPIGETCNGGETCDGDLSPECPDDPDVASNTGSCDLSLKCSGGRRDGLACRVEADSDFGTVSAECLPNEALNISGTGLDIVFNPATSGIVTFTSNAGAAVPCTQSGFENYDCACPSAGTPQAVPSKPNECFAACNAGAELGQGCGTANGNFGQLTTCVGGTEAGAFCDQDADCGGGGTCTGNPTHCIGGTNDLTTCSTNGDCTGGGTCEDACPSGLCVPLCLELGRCDGGSTPNAKCATDDDCSGGSCSKSPRDSEYGVCAVSAGFTHCDGAGKEFLECTAAQVGTLGGCEWGIDGIEGSLDDNPGAGTCVRDPQPCFVNDGYSFGGTNLDLVCNDDSPLPLPGATCTTNGDCSGGECVPLGGPTNFKSATAYCIAPTSNGAVNGTAGLGGPGRLVTIGTNAVNYTELPVP